MNRFICTAKYLVPCSHSYYTELLDTKTGIVYLQTSAGEGSDNVVPLLFDNGKPQHLNKEEVEKVQKMIRDIGEERYERIVQRNYGGYDDDSENKFKEFDLEWTIEDVYNALCKTK